MTRVSNAIHNLGVIDNDPLLKEPFMEVLGSSTEEYKKQFAQNLASELTKIAGSNDRSLACRIWIVAMVEEYAPITALLVTEHDDDHPCLKEGLWNYADQIIENSFYYLYRKIGEVSACKDFLITESNRIHFQLEVANIGRLIIEDYSEGNSDWYRKFMLAAIANFDAIYRGNLNLEPYCEVAEIIIEYHSIRENLLCGYKNPLEGVKFAKG